MASPELKPGKAPEPREKAKAHVFETTKEAVKGAQEALKRSRTLLEQSRVALQASRKCVPGRGKT